MSNNIFPTFQGISWNKTVTPIMNTVIYTSDSGLETRRQHYSYPLYKIELNYNFLADNSISGITLTKGDLETLKGFYNNQGGCFGSFLYLDDVENTCTAQVFGTGNGSNKVFRLTRSLPGWTEPICGIITAPLIYVNGIATSAFTFDNNGNITFTTAPANGAVLTWTGKYYFRVRFQEDSIELSRTWQGLWENISVKLITVKV